MLRLQKRASRTKLAFMCNIYNKIIGNNLHHSKEHPNEPYSHLKFLKKLLVFIISTSNFNRMVEDSVHFLQVLQSISY